MVCMVAKRYFAVTGAIVVTFNCQEACLSSVFLKLYLGWLPLEHLLAEMTLFALKKRLAHEQGTGFAVNSDGLMQA